MYSQNNEEQIILNYFGDTIGRVLDIGANNGKTFSNSLALIERGWSADLIEPHPKAFEKLSELHKQNNLVTCHNFAVSDKTGTMIFHMNDPHITGDIGLLSTGISETKDKWNLNWKTISVDCISWTDFYEGKTYDFITIDAEGMDYDILKQIDLAQVRCRMVCVEHNGNDIDKFIDYCAKFGMTVRTMNPENLIMVI